METNTSAPMSSILAPIPRRTFKLEVTKGRIEVVIYLTSAAVISISFKILVGKSTDFLNLSVGENQNFEWQHWYNYRQKI